MPAETRTDFSRPERPLIRKTGFVQKKSRPDRLATRIRNRNADCPDPYPSGRPALDGGAATRGRMRPSCIRRPVLGATRLAAPQHAVFARCVRSCGEIRTPCRNRIRRRRRRHLPRGRCNPGPHPRLRPACPPPEHSFPWSILSC